MVVNVNKQMQIYKDYIRMLDKGHINSILCHSKAGFGKTFTTINMLKELNLKYEYNNGVVTAVELYKLLYDNRNNILILDDIETIFQDDRIINLLKSALWEVYDKREISYRTSSKILEAYPSKFIYNGKIIILANEIRGRGDESFKALMSRCLKYELVYTLKDLKDIGFYMIDNNDKLNLEEKEITKEILIESIKPQHNFNFRLLQRLISCVKYDKNKARELFHNSLDIDYEMEMIINIVKNNKKVKDQIMKYNEYTGKSRMTFLRKKKKLEQEGVFYE